MLRTVLGGPKSGKTDMLIGGISKLAAAGLGSILLVPEVVSFEYERLLCARMPDSQLGLVSVKTFRSLCRDIFKAYGGAAKPRADRAAKIALARRAVDSVGEKIVLYRRHGRSGAFYALVADAADELKQSGISPEHIVSLADGDADAARGMKFREFGYIYAAYDALLHDRYSDDADELNDAAELCEPEFFDGVSVFFDCFDGFSQPQLRLISFMLGCCRDMWVSLCTDSLFDDVPLAYSVAAATGRRLFAYADGCGVEKAPPIVLAERHFRSDGIRELGEYLLCGRRPACADGVRRGLFASRYDELGAVAAEIAHLVRKGGYSFSDFAVIAPDVELYKTAVTSAFERYEIPYFCDFHSDLLCSPLAVMASSVLSLAAFGITTDGVMRLIKAGLCDIPDDDINELENYVYVWNIEYRDWEKPFTKNPDGYEESISADAGERLERVERARQAIISPIVSFIKAAKSLPADGMVERLFLTLEALGSSASIQRISAEKTEDSREQVRQYNMCCSMFDSLHTMLYGDMVGYEDMLSLLELLASSIKLHDIPNTLDCALVTRAGLALAGAPRVAFVVGLCEGAFPVTEFSGGFFSNADRDYIAGREIPIQTTFRRRFCIEQAGFLRAVNAASERVYLCSPVSDENGLFETAEIKEYAKLACPDGFEIDALPFSLAQTSDSGLLMFASRYCARDEAAATLAAALLGTHADRVTAVADGARVKDFRIRDPKLCADYFGNQIYASPTNIDAFSNCRMMYFLRYIMRLTPLRRMKLDSLQSGNFVHYVLQIVLGRLKGRLETASAEEIRAVCCSAADSYIERVMGGADANSPHVMHLAQRLKEQTAALVKHIAREQTQSEFKTEFFELEIGDGGVPPRVLETPDGKKICVRGKIDRVDIMRTAQGNFVRVVDYKTGEKRFDLNDIFYGLNIQMLVYLFSLCEKNNGLISDPIPAGVLYLPADPRISDAGDDARKVYKMDGMILDEPEILSAMEKDTDGVFLSYSSRTRDKAQKLSSLERLGNIKKHLDGLVVDMARELYAGDFCAHPLTDGKGASPCAYCDYAGVCGAYRDDTARIRVKRESEKLFESEVADGEQ